jgi:RNA polymerase sigma-70 factor (ECF subfamily)
MRRSWEEADDEELLAAVIARRPQAWEALYGRYERLIIACVRKTLARYTAYLSEDDVEDIVSTVCLNLVKDDFRRLRAFDGTRGYKVSSWLGLIATNTCLDALRRREPRHTSMDRGGPDDEPLQVADPGRDAQAELARAEEQRALLAAIDALTPSDREFFDLMWDVELAPEEIARRLGISVNTVYSRKNKLREKLARAILAPSGARPALSGAAGGALFAPEDAKTGPQGGRSDVD